MPLLTVSPKCNGNGPPGFVGGVAAAGSVAEDECALGSAAAITATTTSSAILLIPPDRMFPPFAFSKKTNGVMLAVTTCGSHRACDQIPCGPRDGRDCFRG